jgi:hypothetical protein
VIAFAAWLCALFGAAVLTVPPAFAQNQHGDQKQPPAPGAHVHDLATQNAPPSEVSGTAWLPGVTPTYGFHRQVRGWDLMAHGNAFAQFLLESGEVHRRSHQFGSINWIMGMATRPVGTSRIGVRLMASLEPWTIGGCGYPDLLATGEICRRDSIHDRQHPHDLFMELAAQYDRPLKGGVRWQIYGGPAGEPALGPPGFPHRLSALPNPIAPITHHWLDSTHITFGVVTAGIYGTRWKLESSAFNGREPDPVRTDLDLGRLDSFSGRLSLAPTPRFTFQASAGHLPQAEAGVGRLPRTDVNRATASASYHRPIGADGYWATTLAYGVNSQLSIIPGALVQQTSHGVLFETSLISQRNSWFGRIEVVGKPAHDFHADEYATRVFTVEKVEVGYTRYLRPVSGLVPGIGGMVMSSFVPPLLAPRYGGRTTAGFGVFFTVRPAEHHM